MANQLDDDNQGNVLGERTTFVYTDNRGTVWNMTQDSSVAVAVGNVLSTDATPPLLPLGGDRPFRPRYILLEGQTEPEKKKKVYIGSATNPLFLGTTTTVSINAVTYRVTRPVGEQRPIPRVQPAT